MIKIIRKPNTSDVNREYVQMILPNDNNPEEVVNFLNRFFKLLGYAEPETPEQTDETTAKISLVHEPMEDEEDIEIEDKNTAIKWTKKQKHGKVK